MNPPASFQLDWLKPPDRASYRVFQLFKRDTPRGVIPGGSTVQGLYCLTADGDFLSGQFGRASATRAQQVIETGWQKFSEIARERRWSPKPVPAKSLDSALGVKPGTGHLKLQVAVRDLPRGREANPGRESWQQSAYNINWLDLTTGQSKLFVTDSEERQKLPQSLIAVFSPTLRDSVRGQCFDWHRNAARQGALYTRCIERSGDVLTMQITGDVNLRQPDRSFVCQLHGRVVYDTRRQQFRRFDLVAAGQRSGTSQFNFRNDDAGPAPMGVAYTLYEPQEGTEISEDTDPVN